MLIGILFCCLPVMCRDESHDRVNQVSGSCHRHCKTWQQAIDGYHDAYNNKRVKALPEPGLKYWTEPLAVTPNVRSRPSRPSSSSEELYWVAVEEDEQEFGADELAAHISSINLQG
jgi:hypothetical protein